jgi:hypothetical protein
VFCSCLVFVGLFRVNTVFVVSHRRVWKRERCQYHDAFYNVTGYTSTAHMSCMTLLPSLVVILPRLLQAHFLRCLSGGDPFVCTIVYLVTQNFNVFLRFFVFFVMLHLATGSNRHFSTSACGSDSDHWQKVLFSQCVKVAAARTLYLSIVP